MISIVIPTYNRCFELKKAIDSLTKQNFGDELEIIIVDDGSTDGTEKTIKAIGKIKYLKQQNSGAATARNKGGFNARGEFIMFLDSDCLIDKDCINNILAEIKNSHTNVVTCRITGITKGFWAKCHDYSHFHGFMVNKRTEKKFPCGSGFLIKKELFESINGFNAKLKVAEDEDLGMRLSEGGEKIIYLPNAIVYHDHGRKKFKQFIRHPYNWAKKGSVLPYLIYKHSTYNNFASNNPWYYLIFSPFIAGLVTLRIFFRIFPQDKYIIFYAPFIFINKLAWCLGTFNFLLKK